MNKIKFQTGDIIRDTYEGSKHLYAVVKVRNDGALVVRRNNLEYILDSLYAEHYKEVSNE